MKAYLDIADNILSKGKWKGNRTGVRTLALPNQHFSHNMRDGFPLLTTKKMPFKTIATELEGFIKGITDKRWYQERGCTIWNEWSNPEQLPQKIVMLDADDQEVWENISGEEKLNWQKENPDLGPLGYSHGWRNFNGNYKPIPFIWTDLDKSITIQESIEDAFNLVGNTYNGKFGVYTVISCQGQDKYHNLRYTVKFRKSGFVKNNVNKTQIISKSIFDPYYPNVAGVACLGDYSWYTDRTTLIKLINQWKQMIHRCYNPNHKSYNNYGAKGIYVCNRWLIFSNFLNDVSDIEGWYNKYHNWKDYQLDKDIKGKGYYSKNTCLWVNRSQNTSYTQQNYYFDAVDPNGNVYQNNLGLKRFCKQHKLKVKNVEASIRNNTNTHNGWKFIRKKQYNTNLNYKGYDQFARIVDTLKINPNDRRMVCSAWNPIQIDRMALPPCHFCFVLTHIDGVLNLHWTQRSCDLFLGVPFNIASYGLLLTLLCQEADMIPGNLSGMLCDCHIYENHIDQFRMQLARQPKHLPVIQIDRWNGIYNWEATDCTIQDYHPHPAIKAEVAI